MLLLYLILAVFPRVFSQGCPVPWIDTGACPEGNECLAGASCSAGGRCCYDNCPAPIGDCLGSLCPDGHTCVNLKCCPDTCPNNTGACDVNNKCAGGYDCEGGVCCPQISGPCLGDMCPGGFECKNDFCFVKMTTSTVTTTLGTTAGTTTPGTTAGTTTSGTTAGTTTPGTTAGTTTSGATSPSGYTTTPQFTSQTTESTVSSTISTTSFTTSNPCRSNQTSCSNGQCPEGYICNSSNYCMQCKSASGVFSFSILFIFVIL